MRRLVWTGTLVFALITGGRGVAGECSCCEPSQQGFLARFAPVGGWHPDAGGLLHWWPCHCFPCSGAPDTYCRKPLPHVCWPPYPPFYIGGPPDVCHPPVNGCRDCIGPD